MLPTLLFCTSNQNKFLEAEVILKPYFTLESLKSISYSKAIAEPFETLEENAIIKAKTIAEYLSFNQMVFSEDTGLEIEALHNLPGVKSARFAGEQAHWEDNVNKVLQFMKNKENRKAKFRTIICLMLDKKRELFEGITQGKITEKPIGNNGFGYDSIFIPEGQNKTFAEMDLQTKNRFSHRKKALEKMRDFLLKKR